MKKGSMKGKFYKDFDQRPDGYNYWSSVHSFKLRDGSDVTRVMEGQNIYPLVRDSLYLYLEDITEKQTGANMIHCEYVRL